MLFYTTFARYTFTVSLNELFENYTGRRTQVYSGHTTRLKYPHRVIGWQFYSIYEKVLLIRFGVYAYL